VALLDRGEHFAALDRDAQAQRGVALVIPVADQLVDVDLADLADAAAL
jgi:hypothetical protein